MAGLRSRTLVILTVAWSAWFVAPAARSEEMDAEKALARLKQGNARYVAEHRAKKDVSARRRLEVSTGQHPFAIVLCCADSRTAPELVFDQGLGDVFTVRVAGNVTDPAVIGSIEYAAAHLKSPLIVVMGHSHCGAVKAALEGKNAPTENLHDLIRRVHVGFEVPENKEEAVATGVRVNVTHQARRLVKDSPLLQEFVELKRVRVISAVYSLETGEVEWVDAAEAGHGKKAVARE